MGNVLLLLAVLVIVGVIVRAGDQALKRELAVYGWGALLSSEPGGKLIELAVRLEGRHAVVALDGMDLSPSLAALQPDDAGACIYCRTFVAHTSALCGAAFDRYGHAELGPWAPITRELRAHLVAVAVATPLVAA